MVTFRLSLSETRRVHLSQRRVSYFLSAFRNVRNPLVSIVADMLQRLHSPMHWHVAEQRDAGGFVDSVELKLVRQGCPWIPLIRASLPASG